MHKWTDKDEQQLIRIKNREINMSETHLGRYAALQKRNALLLILPMRNGII